MIFAGNSWTIAGTAEKANKQNAPTESHLAFCGGVFGKRPAGGGSFLPGGAAGAGPALGYAHQVGAAGVVFVVAAGAVVTADVGLGLAGSVVHRGVGVALVAGEAGTHGVVGAAVVHLDGIQAAASALVVTAILFTAIQISHAKHLRP